MLPLKDYIQPEQLTELASRSNFRYGKDILKNGEVSFIKTNRFNSVATVKPIRAEKRTTELHSTSKGLRWKCTCTGKKNYFCEHCVAVGLALTP